MKNKFLIKNWALITLMITVITVGFSWFQNETKTAQAAINTNESALIDINLNTYSNNSIIEELRHDTDAEGNQVYVWRSSYLDETETPIQGIFYQVYNRAGIPLNLPTLIFGVTSDNTFNSPDVSFVEGGGFVITFGRAYPGTMIVQAVFVDNNYNLIGPVQVNNSGFARNPRIASDLYGGSGTVGIVYESCSNSSCDAEIDLYFQALYASDLSHVVINSNFKVNTTNGAGQTNTYGNIAYGNSHYMVSWKHTDGTATSIKALAMLANISNASSEVIVSNTGNNEDMPDITGLMGELPITRSGSSNLDYLQNFYVAYTATTQATGSQDILIKKIICESVYNPLSGTYTVNVCSPATRNGEDITVRANSSGAVYDYQPAISAFKSNNQILRIAGDESSRIDYLTVAWLNATANDPELKIQNYTDSLVKAGNIIEAATSVSSSRGIAISSNRDGHFTLSYSNAVGSPIPHSLLYPTQYLRVGSEKLVNPPDSNIEANPVVAVSPDGNHVVVHEFINSNGDRDIIYNVYDRYGNAVKSNTVATATTSGDQYSPRVEYFQDDSTSGNFGKFVIAWEGEGNGDNRGIFYRIFNPDGSPEGNETIVNDITAGVQTMPDLAVGKNGQIGIVYINGNNIGDAKIAYINSGTIITNTLGTNGYTPHIALSPVADGSTGLSGKSKFAASYNIATGKVLTEGYLNSSSSLTLLTPETNSDTYYDLDGGYRNDFETGLTVNSNEGFFYAASYLNADSTPIIKASIFNSTYSTDLSVNSDNAPLVSIDPATGNIMTIHQVRSPYTNYWNRLQVFLSPAYSLSTFTTGMHIIDEIYQYQADVIDNFGTHAFIENASGIFDALRVGTYDPYNTTTISAGRRLDFTNDVSTHFTLGQTVTGQSSGDSGTVAAISNYFIVIENQTGDFLSGENLNNSPYNDQILTSSATEVFHFDFDEGLSFEVGNDIRNQALTALGVIEYVSGPTVTATTTAGVFGPSDTVLDFNAHGFASADTIEYPEINIHSLEITIIPAGAGPEERYPEWLIQGSGLSASHNNSYGQTIQNSAIDYNTTSADTDGRLAAAVYSTTTALDRLDSTGIYLQIIDDPFNMGTREDLSPSAEQQIDAGGKYIIVPQTIDFGQVDRNTTNTIRFSDLSPACLQVTDLDGTDFDLTVSLTNLVNSVTPTETIPNSQFYIENNDGINPTVSTSYSFTSLSDVTIDPSTDPGQNADLGTTQTLLRKNNTNTGSWTICPTLNFSVPSNAPTGTANGTMTFTLI